MAERIEVPPTLQGDEKEQLRQVWSYLYQLSEAINNNLDAIGGNELTDSERKSMQQILQDAGVTQDGASTDFDTLKGLIIKTADYVQSSLQEYRMSLLGETVASGQFGRYVRQTGLDVEVTPEGITQNYSLQEVAQDLKHYEVNAKNYIKTGLLRTVGSIPVYGVAIGKDIVTFSEDGTETYNDGNKVAELTADELSFWQGGEKVAGYTGSKISFYYNGVETFYIQNGKLHSVNDIELSAGKKVIMGEWEISDDGLIHKDPDEEIGFEIAKYADRDPLKSGIYYRYNELESGYKIGEMILAPAGLSDTSEQLRGLFILGVQESPSGGKMKYIKPFTGTGAYDTYLGTSDAHYGMGYIDYLKSSNLMDIERIYGKSGGTGIHVYPKGNTSVGFDIFELDISGDKIIQISKLSGVQKLEWVGNVTGNVTGGVNVQAKAETNLNNYYDSGIYSVSMSSCTNKPSDISLGSGLLEVFRQSTNLILQRLSFDNFFYIREYILNSWGSWYKFTGTAV